MVYFSEIDVLQNVTTVQKTNLIKYEIVLPCPYEKAISALSPSVEIPKYSPNVKSFKHIVSRSYDEIKECNKTATNILKDKSCVVGIFDIKLNFPMVTLRKFQILFFLTFKVSSFNFNKFQ
jgi:hypothetical protein